MHLLKTLQRVELEKFFSFLHPFFYILLVVYLGMKSMFVNDNDSDNDYHSKQFRLDW